jgi:hypothetical protein
MYRFVPFLSHVGQIILEFFDLPVPILGYFFGFDLDLFVVIQSPLSITIVIL